MTSSRTRASRATFRPRPFGALAGALTFAVLVVTGGPVGAKDTTLVGVLLGSQEPGNVVTPAFGTAHFTYDGLDRLLSYEITLGGLLAGETGAHIHGPAAPGQNAGILHALPAGNNKVGTWKVPEDRVADLLNGRMYVNVHTSMFPGGEIRAQIADLAARITGSQENPPVSSKGHGWATLNLDECNETLEYYVWVDDLESAETGAHIHGRAIHGTNAGVMHGLGTGMIKTGTFDYGATGLTAQEILDGQLYINVHTNGNPGGEVRGQIVSTVNAIHGSQAVPPVTSLGHGAGFFSIDRDNDTLGYHVTHADLTGAPTGAHIHGFVPRGQSAGVVHSLTTAAEQVGQWFYASGREMDILSGRTYVNIHTAMFPGGEIRGQIEFAVPPCLGDVNCDGNVDFGDILAILAAWGDTGGPEDVDGDGVVAFGDILVVLGEWGPCD